MYPFVHPAFYPYNYITVKCDAENTGNVSDQSKIVNGLERNTIKPIPTVNFVYSGFLYFQVGSRTSRVSFLNKGQNDPVYNLFKYYAKAVRLLL